MVDASPSALFDRTQHCATGLPSKTQDRSIGLGVRFTTRLAASMRELDIANLKRIYSKNRPKTQKRMELGEARPEINNDPLSFPYGYLFNTNNGSHEKTIKSRLSAPTSPE